MSKRPLRTVLIADDSRIFRAVVREVFDDLGVAVVDADSGPQALSMIRSHQPDLVLLDILMPGLDGLQVAASLEQSELDPKPVVFLTTGVYRSAQQRQEVLSTHHVAAYLAKPVAPEVLRAALDERFELSAPKATEPAAEAAVPAAEEASQTKPAEPSSAPATAAARKPKQPSKPSTDRDVDDLLASVGLDPGSLQR